MKKNLIYESVHDSRKNLMAYFHKLQKNAYTPTHFHRCIEIIYFVEGGAKITANGTSFEIKQDEIFFSRRCAQHEIEYYDSSSVLLIIPPKFSNDFESIFQDLSLATHLKDIEFNKTLKEYFLHLSKNEETSDMVIKGYVNIIIGKLLEHYPKEKNENPSNIDVIIDVLNYIDRHFTEDITLDVISKRFGYNKYYFSRLFNDTVGESLTSYVNGVRISNLLIKVRKTDKANLSKLILDYGFESFSTFYRACYNKYNLPPKKLLKLENI